MAGNGGATLRTWTSSSASEATPLGRLDIVIPETLTAARFDGSRVYVVTAERVDPLWVVDAADPARPVLAGQLHMPGQLEFIEPRGDRLLALGHTNEAGQPWQLAVSLVDVADPALPTLRARVIVGDGWGGVGAAPDDLRKAFRVIDAAGLALVPYQGWTRRAGSGPAGSSSWTSTSPRGRSRSAASSRTRGRSPGPSRSRVAPPGSPRSPTSGSRSWTRPTGPLRWRRPRSTWRAP